MEGRRIEEWDVIILYETWIDSKGWEKINMKLPKGYMSDTMTQEEETGKEGQWEER